jgi:hypothetical protein
MKSMNVISRRSQFASFAVIALLLVPDLTQGKEQIFAFQTMAELRAFDTSSFSAGVAPLAMTEGFNRVTGCFKTGGIPTRIIGRCETLQ